MAIDDIVLIGDPRLREKSEDVVDFRSEVVTEIKDDLKTTLLELQALHNRGGGLAAPQLGYLKKIIYLNARGQSLYLINPEITIKSQALFEVWDLCFSAKAAFVARIKRHKQITVQFQDEDGQTHTREFKDYWSELVQHEIDHLHGRLFIDHIDTPGSITMIEPFNKQNPPQGPGY
ncbi:MAG: peptide deformylase [Myxococcota bacterium]|nr:peptide deformylase [Myxococcota bacterium]